MLLYYGYVVIDGPARFLQISANKFNAWSGQITISNELLYIIHDLVMSSSPHAEILKENKNKKCVKSDRES